MTIVGPQSTQKKFPYHVFLACLVPVVNKYLMNRFLVLKTRLLLSGPNVLNKKKLQLLGTGTDFLVFFLFFPQIFPFWIHSPDPSKGFGSPSAILQ